MRTLSPQEITRIDQRLESLKINYLEIYLWLRNHYFTELEKNAIYEFEATFEQLNETFAWSVVKKMEKDLRKITSKRIAHLQWDSLNIKKLRWCEVVLAAILLIAFPIIYIQFGLIDLMITLGIISLICAIAIWSWVAIKSSLNYSITKHKPISCISVELFGRMVMPLGSFSWLFFGARWISEYHNFWIFDLFFIIIVISSTISLFSITKVIWTKKYKLA
jgi:hypothetical protein